MTICQRCLLRWPAHSPGSRYARTHGFVRQPNPALKRDAPHSALSRSVVMRKILGPAHIIAARPLAVALGVAPHEN